MVDKRFFFQELWLDDRGVLTDACVEASVPHKCQTSAIRFTPSLADLGM